MRPWLATCLLLAAGSLAFSLALGARTAPLLAWSAEAWTLRPWTLWTAAWVPASAGSVAGHLLVLLAVACIGDALGAGRRSALALLLAWPLSTLALALWPQVRGYAGLAAPTHAAAMVLWPLLALRPGFKPLSFVLVAAMGLKLAAERGWVLPVAFDPQWGGNVVVVAHLTGAVAGALCGWILQVGPLMRSLYRPDGAVEKD
jgi:hypothetical protein